MHLANGWSGKSARSRLWRELPLQSRHKRRSPVIAQIAEEPFSRYLFFFHGMVKPTREASTMADSAHGKEQGLSSGIDREPAQSREAED